MLEISSWNISPVVVVHFCVKVLSASSCNCIGLLGTLRDEARSVIGNISQWPGLIPLQHLVLVLFTFSSTWALSMKFEDTPVLLGHSLGINAPVCPHLSSATDRWVRQKWVVSYTESFEVSSAEPVMPHWCAVSSSQVCRYQWRSTYCAHMCFPSLPLPVETYILCTHVLPKFAITSGDLHTVRTCTSQFGFSHSFCI